MSQFRYAVPSTLISAKNFGSNGINDRYIPHECYAESNVAVFSIKDVHFWLNQYPPYAYVPNESRHESAQLKIPRSIRLSSWRGCSRLSIDYNTAYYTQDDMQMYLDDVARYMLTFAS